MGGLTAPLALEDIAVLPSLDLAFQILLGGFRGLPCRPVRGHQPVRHPRQEGDHHAQGHPARQEDPRREGLKWSRIKTN